MSGGDWQIGRPKGDRDLEATLNAAPPKNAPSRAASLRIVTDNPLRHATRLPLILILDDHRKNSLLRITNISQRLQGKVAANL